MVSRPSSGGQDVAVFLGMVEGAARAAPHAGHRILVGVDRQSRLLLQQHVEAADQRPPAGHDDPPIHDVRSQLRWGDLERTPHRVDDLLDRLLHRLANLARVHPHDFRDADRKSTRLNSSHGYISYAVFCLKKKKKSNYRTI